MNIAAHLKQVMACMDQGNLVEAAKVCDHVLASHPQLGQAQLLRGLIAVRQVDSVNAEIHLKKASELEKTPGSARLQYARFLMARGQWEKAAAAFEPLAQGPATPGDVASIQLRAWYGDVLFRMRRLEDAQQVLEDLIPLAPGAASLRSFLGQVYRDLKDFENANRCWREALRCDPLHQPSALNLTRLMMRANQTEEASTLLKIAISQVEKANQNAFALRLEEAILMPVSFVSDAAIRRWRSRYEQKLAALHTDDLQQETAQQASKLVQTTFFAHYTCNNERHAQKLYGGLIHGLMTKAWPAYQTPCISVPRPRIRVGFASFHFRNHTVTRLFRGWIKGLNPERFEIGLYPHAPADEWTRELSRWASRLHPLTGETEVDIRMLRSEELDVLIFPEIGMHANILLMAAARCAPIQASTWGHPITSGLPTMDVFLSSAAMEPPDAADHYTERLHCLPGLSLFLEEPVLPPQQYHRADFDLKEDQFVVLCTQSLFKLLPRHDYVFAKIALRVPRVRIVLLGPTKDLDATPTLDRIRWAFAQEGLEMDDYLHVVPHQAHQGFIDLNRAADVFLDGMDWSGGQTTLEAVACGLLPVTNWGPQMRMRHTAAILNELGLPELIAEDANGVIERVLRLATEADWRAQLQARLHANLHRLYHDPRVIPALESWIESEVARVRGAH